VRVRPSGRRRQLVPGPVGQFLPRGRSWSPRTGRGVPRERLSAGLGPTPNSIGGCTLRDRGHRDGMRRSGPSWRGASVALVRSSKARDGRLCEALNAKAACWTRNCGSGSGPATRTLASS
jgi:hypothetical protein